MADSRPLPLEGIRIVSFAQLLQGPSGVQILADLGADVIKVERPVAGAWERSWSGGEAYVGGESVFFLLGNRNQRGLTANLKSEQGREVVLKLIEGADLLVENYRPGVMERLGMGYDDLKAMNPGLIYVSCSGYGSSGPYRDEPGQDLLAQALSGLAAATGSAGDPPIPAGAAIVDQHAAVLLALGALAALMSRAQTGEGQKLEVNLLSAALDLQIESLAYYLNGFDVSRRSESGLGTTFHPPPYGIYETSDNYIALSLTSGTVLAKALDEPELARWADEERLAHRDEMNRIIQERIRERSTEEWLTHLRAEGVWCSRVHTYETLMEDPQFRHNDPVQEFEYPGTRGVRVLRHPIRYSNLDPSVRCRPPLLGEHTREILTELGYSEQQIAELRKAGAV